MHCVLSEDTVVVTQRQTMPIKHNFLFAYPSVLYPENAHCIDVPMEKSILKSSRGSSHVKM